MVFRPEHLSNRQKYPPNLDTGNPTTLLKTGRETTNVTDPIGAKPKRSACIATYPNLQKI